MQIDLTSLLQALIGLLSAFITAKLIPWLKAKTTAQNAEITTALIKTLVFAAEQIFKTDQGSEKLEYVKQELESRGIVIDDAAIEAAVCELKISIKE